MKIEAVIWDVDGTLIDSNELHAKAWRDAFSRQGIDLPLDEIRAQIGKGGDLLVPDLLDAAQVRRIGDTIRDERATIFREQYRERVKAFPFVREAFEVTKSSAMTNVIATSAQKEDLDYFLELIDVGDLLDDATSAGEVESSKPAPDVFRVAMEKSGKKPAELIVVGDTPWDILASHRCGIAIAAVRTGGFSDEDLQSAERIFDDALIAAKAITNGEMKEE